MDTLSAIYSHICSQGRCFAIDGCPLPVCQRCLGLYAGAALTLVWLLAARPWRRGLPPVGVLAAHVAILLAALLGGLHVIDPGPRWRMVCGLGTGHVIVVWLICGSAALRRASPACASQWRWHDTAEALAAAGLLGIVAAGFDALAPLGWTFWTAMVLAGTFSLGAATMIAVAAACREGLSRLFGRHG